MDSAEAKAQAQRQLRRALTRRSDGSRGLFARRAWRRLVQNAAAGWPHVQDAIRAAATELPPSDVLELLDAAPQREADRAAYLSLIGQHEQRHALDPDGTLFAEAYHATDPITRRRLRTVLTETGDSTALRSVVTSDRSDHLASLTATELGYFAGQLASQDRWDDLRLLTLSLALPQAATVAALFPPRHRTGEHAPLLDRLAAVQAGRLTDTVRRLPASTVTHLDRHSTDGDISTGDISTTVSFSPDSAEFALLTKHHLSYGDRKRQPRVETIHVGSGEVRTHPIGRLDPHTETNGLLHLGGEVLLQLRTWGVPDHTELVRLTPTPRQGLGRLAPLSRLERSSGGAVCLGRHGELIFADIGSDQLRKASRSLTLGESHPYDDSATSAIATLPSHGLVAVAHRGRMVVTDEDGALVAEFATNKVQKGATAPAVAFTSPTSIAVCHRFQVNIMFHTGKLYTEMWDFSGARPRCTGSHRGRVLDKWPWKFWLGLPMADHFAQRLFSIRPDGLLDNDAPQPANAKGGGMHPTQRRFGTLSPHKDSMIINGYAGHSVHLELHSPYLPAARALLELPLVQATPRHLHEVGQLRKQIHDPQVLDALTHLELCLADYFGADSSPEDRPDGG
ncbi:hypothetical protein ACIBBB_04345 [Streptomyces sp. NPDC051217]|uniref:hypothetical protein n=1 Tax=Streptomyces sp. NPDC051217 TaxID=3365644 RepID=UPI00379AA6C3